MVVTNKLPVQQLRDKKFDHDSKVDMVVMFIQGILADEESCVQQADNKGASTSCTCLKQHLGYDEEQDDDENVATRCIARWIVDHYAGLTPEQGMRS
jgi:hypothetical protein